MRPQRASREMSIIGAKVQSMPALAASAAATAAPASTNAGLNVAACPIGIGRMVLKP